MEMRCADMGLRVKDMVIRGKDMHLRAKEMITVLPKLKLQRKNWDNAILNFWYAFLKLKSTILNFWYAFQQFLLWGDKNDSISKFFFQVKSKYLLFEISC